MHSATTSKVSVAQLDQPTIGIETPVSGKGVDDHIESSWESHVPEVGHSLCGPTWDDWVGCHSHSGLEHPVMESRRVVVILTNEIWLSHKASMSHSESYTVT